MRAQEKGKLAGGNAATKGKGGSRARSEAPLPDVLQMQRTAGNRAVASLVAPVPAPLQRYLNAEQQQTWKNSSGPASVAALRKAVDDWRRFRAAPDSYDGLPLAGRAPSELAELLRFSDRTFAQHAADELGGEAVKYLGEMAGFVPRVRDLIGFVPGVTWVDPKHQYVLKTRATVVDDINKVKSFPVGTYVVEYRNAYGWYWSKNLTGSQLQWSVGFSRSSKAGDRDLKAGGKGFVPEPTSISINSEATATSVAYWGYKDLAGVISTADGPKISGGFRGWGVKSATGGIITFHGAGSGPAGNLPFMNVVHEVKLSTSTGSAADSLKGGRAVTDGGKVSLQIAAVGMGVMVGGEQTVAIPRIEPTPVMEELVFDYVVSGFETGAAQLPIPPGELHPIINLIRSDMSDKKRNVDSIKPVLRGHGIEQDFVLDFYCEGFASRRWQGARNDTERQQRNLTLSETRAQNVTAALHEAFGPTHAYTSVGKGAALVMSGGKFGEAVPEADPAVVEEKVRRREERIRASNQSDFTEEQIAAMLREYRKSLLETNARDSDVAIARRVNIKVIWRGYNLQYGANSTPAATAVP